MQDFEAPVPASASRFWHAFVFSCILIAITAAFNAVIDPVGQIGMLQPNRWSRAMPAAIVRWVREQQDVSAYRRIIGTTGADTFLIGTSREARGFDLCDQPGMLRIAGSNWGIREFASIQQSILESRVTPVTLLIEVGVVSDPSVTVQRRNYGVINAALAPTTTAMSIQTVAYNVRSNKTDEADKAMCQPLRAAFFDWRVAATDFREKWRINNDIGARLRGLAILRQMIVDANFACRTTGLRHQIIFFTLPDAFPSQDRRQYETYFRLGKARLARVIREYAPSSACGLRFIDLSAGSRERSDERSLWRARDNWLDFIHFSPKLGQVALRELKVAR